MATELRYTTRAQQTAVTTEMNGLANNAGALSASVIDQSTPWAYGTFEWSGSFTSAPSAGGGFDLYACEARDGTTYESVTPGASPVPPGFYLGFLTVLPSTGAQTRTVVCPLPPHNFKVFPVNKTGQAAPSSNTLVMTPVTELGVSV